MKRKRTDWIRRAVSVLLTLILCAQAAGPILAVEDGVIRITCAEDLLELSRNCALDTWSQGKHVALTADISLAGTGYTPRSAVPLTVAAILSAGWTCQAG